MLSAKKQDKNVEVEEAAKKHKEQKVLMKDFENRLKKAEAKLKQAQDLRYLCLIDKNAIHATKAECESQKAVAERKRADQEETVRSVTEQGMQACGGERYQVPAGETYASLEKQYSSLRARLKKMQEKAKMDDQAVHDFFARAKKTHDAVVADLRSSTQINERLRASLTVRLDKWRKFQRYISSQSRANFIYLLSERGFRGKLLLDHERKALDLQVEPDRTEKRAAGRSTKTLSGGEKSFSSICLLLAIWEAMGSPLRCLDEFDVFMDNVNRAISTNMLVSLLWGFRVCPGTAAAVLKFANRRGGQITAARRSVNRQYIFITPNAIEGRNALEKDVKIIR
jgi:chromosome segregation ATPase